MTEWCLRDRTAQGGVNGIEVGDGYHDYLVAGIVSCNCKGLVDTATHRVTGATLTLTTSRFYGSNPFYFLGAKLYTDMVGVVVRSCRLQ